MKTNNKFLLFMRKNAFYFVLGFCILAVALSVTLLLVLDTSPSSTVEKPPVVQPEDPVEPSKPSTPTIPDEPDEPTKPVTPSEPTKPTVTEILFIMPVDGTVTKDYSESMVFNSTLGLFSAHLAMDFSAPDGSNVYAVYDGVIESVTSGYLTGTTVIIDHGDGLKSVYNSLADGDAVTVGQTVKKGDVIGVVSASNLQEMSDGAHLHFEVTENGVKVNPLKYLVAEEK